MAREKREAWGGGGDEELGAKRVGGEPREQGKEMGEGEKGMRSILEGRRGGGREGGGGHRQGAEMRTGGSKGKGAPAGRGR